MNRRYVADMLKTWPIILPLLLSMAAGAQTPSGEPDEPLEEVLVSARQWEVLEEDQDSWVDDSYAYASERTQALAEWMDGFFGDPTYDLEKAESHLRLRYSTSYNPEDDFNNKLRLRGKLKLPSTSERLSLVFSGEDGDDPVLPDNRRTDLPGESDSQAGLVYNISEIERNRYDLTLGLTSSGLKPGARFRRDAPIWESYEYRYTQRLEWEIDEGFYTTGRVNLNRALSNSQLARWSNRIIYGEETEGAEWRSTLSLSRRLVPGPKNRERVNSVFASVRGETDDANAINYSAGFLFRRQVYRPFIFVELEPAYHYRTRPEEGGNNTWGVLLRFEFLLKKDLVDKAAEVFATNEGGG